ncbi:MULTISPECIES: TetR/AcrR family transcriptional regulator [Moritella]|uniref:Transcriptional regulator, TetR family n=2 Tax=Moritella TaxID=58050 RepID=A0A090IJG6_9GAMM|nr:MULTISPECIES: TetR/AcrR family transcriptional regulator [Moritella]QFI36549.1 TetR/AcrR family transcriptional regulator [Moritella marina ATCC 15381]CED61377.1 HTH-type transcriptional regulator, TetR family [Moritella viscosa]SGY88752.1 Transcriptional regulator, TetR family [Moritella viscosa]SGY92268.1 Transcriptional regulator, TetR family [Moritella viscosa]SGY92286.1 Transcriptional regulator, TetR family [Moritella viscosa]
MVSKLDTKTRILDAAESLFAEHGFSDTSLRLITTRASVNLASVNYHFGSKKELIQAVIARHLELFMPLLNEKLTALCTQVEKPSLLDVFNSFVDPLLALEQQSKNGTVIFMQLLGRSYTDEQGHLRWYTTTHYGEVLANITKALLKANPALSSQELFWRLHFTLGTAVFTMGSSGALMDIAKADFNQDIDVEGLIRKVIPYLASGMNTSTETTSM